MKVVFLWNVTVYHLVEIHGHFGRTCALYLCVGMSDSLNMESKFLPKVDEFVPFHTVSRPERR